MTTLVHKNGVIDKANADDWLRCYGSSSQESGNSKNSGMFFTKKIITIYKYSFVWLPKSNDFTIRNVQFRVDFIDWQSKSDTKPRFDSDLIFRK